MTGDPLRPRRIKPIYSGPWFVRDNLTSPVVRMSMLANGDIAYTLAHGLCYVLNEDGVAYINRIGYTPRLSPELQARMDALEPGDRRSAAQPAVSAAEGQRADNG